MTARRSIRQRARDAGIPEGTVTARLHAGWSLRRALSTPPRDRQPDATPEAREEAIASVLAGRETQAEVARRLGVTAQAVCYWLRAHRDRIPRDDPRRAEVERLLRGGDTYRDIQDATGVALSTIVRWAREAGIRRAPGPAPRRR